MKKNFVFLALATLLVVNSVQADCSYQYSRASTKRTYRDMALVVAGSFAVGAPMLFTNSALVAGLGWTGYLGGLLVAFPKSQNWKNSFDHVKEASIAAKSGKENKHLDKILRKAAKKANVEYTPEVSQRLSGIMGEAYDQEVFCPVVGQKKNGRARHAVFTKSAVIKYLSNHLIVGKE